MTPLSTFDGGAVHALRRAYGRALAADAGSYTINGSDAGFIRTLIMSANAGAYAVNGMDTRAALELEDFPSVTSGGGVIVINLSNGKIMKRLNAKAYLEV